MDMIDEKCSKAFKRPTLYVCVACRAGQASSDPTAPRPGNRYPVAAEVQLSRVWGLAFSSSQNPEIRITKPSNRTPNPEAPQREEDLLRPSQGHPLNPKP